MAEAVQSVRTPGATPMTRREFLYYVWGASMALLLAEASGALLWLAIPRFKEGEFGGVFTLNLGEIPEADSGPKPFDNGRFWLVNLGQKAIEDDRQGLTSFTVQPGVKALYKVCVHLGCLYKWVPTNDRFECPCHGSKYLLSGTRVGGPARRNLDVFILQALDAAGNVIPGAETQPTDGSVEGSAIEIPAGAVALRVNTGKRISGAVNTEDYGIT